MSTSDMTNQQKLEEIYKITLENNEILHRLQRRERLAIILRIVYWLAILGALGGVYYYIRPVIDIFTTRGGKAEGIFQQFEELRSQFPETKALQQFFDKTRSNNIGSSSATIVE